MLTCISFYVINEGHFLETQKTVNGKKNKDRKRKQARKGSHIKQPSGYLNSNKPVFASLNKTVFKPKHFSKGKQGIPYLLDAFFLSFHMHNPVIGLFFFLA